MDELERLGRDVGLSLRNLLELRGFEGLEGVWVLLGVVLRHVV